MTTHLEIGGMTCEHCVNAVTNALQSVPGVTKADVNLESGRAVVEHDGDVAPDALISAVRAEEFDARRASV